MAVRTCRRWAVGRLVVVGQQGAHRRERVARPGDHVEQHRVGDGEVRGERFRRGGQQPIVGRLGPGHEALRRLLALHPAALLLVVTGLGQQPDVLDLVLGRLHDHGAGGVVAGPAGPAGDLVELPGLQVPGALAVVLAQRGEHHRPDRDVDADAEGVGAADDLEQPGLGELFDQPAVLGQHAGVMHPDAVPDQPGQRLAEPGGEPELPDSLGDLVLLRPGADVDAGQRLGLFDRGGLGEMHDVDGGLVGLQQLGDGLVQRGGGVVVEQRHRPVAG